MVQEITIATTTTATRLGAIQNESNIAHLVMAQGRIMQHNFSIK